MNQSLAREDVGTLVRQELALLRTLRQQLATMHQQDTSTRSQVQEGSLREFCERPENKRIINKQQQQQAKRVCQLKQQREALQFQQQVSSCMFKPLLYSWHAAYLMLENAGRHSASQ